MVDDFEIAAHLWIVLLETVDAVRTVRDDFFRAPFHAVALEGRDIGGRELLEKKLVAHSPGRFTRTPFLRPQDREWDLGGREEPGHTAGDLLNAAVVGRRAADPVEHAEVGTVFRERNIQAGGPRQSILCR